jgi:putative glycosyltransferase (TIGR04348 family)
MSKPSICIVTPALADANNGNWQTARRWASMLAGVFQVHLVKSWPTGESQLDHCDGLVALHARRSAQSIEAWFRTFPEKPLVVALTGTDLYRDIHQDSSAQNSLKFAHRLIVLQEQGSFEVPVQWRNKCRLVFQSTPRRGARPKTSRHLRAVMVGHLRDEKWPQVLFEACRQITPGEGILIDHIGQALDPKLGDLAVQTARECSHYRWLGGLSHPQVKGHIQRAHVLIHTSRIEGGAHVILEAVCSGTPVLASNIPGNAGMLGPGYAGYFKPGDSAQLVEMLREAHPRIKSGALRLQALKAQCDARAHLFEPRREQSALIDLLNEFNWISP